MNFVRAVTEETRRKREAVTLGCHKRAAPRGGIREVTEWAERRYQGKNTNKHKRQNAVYDIPRGQKMTEGRKGQKGQRRQKGQKDKRRTTRIGQKSPNRII